MNDNGMGGRRIGKKWHDNQQLYTAPDGHSAHSGRNLEADTDYFSNQALHGNMTDAEKLIHDYFKDKKFIKNQKRKWLAPKERQDEKRSRRR